MLSNLNYEITYKNVKNINIRVRKDGIVAVSAPKHIATDHIENLLVKHYNKFYDAQQKVLMKNENLNTPVAKRSETFILGKKYQLESVKDTVFSYSICANKVVLYYRNQEKDYERMLRLIAEKIFNELSLEVSREMNLVKIAIEIKKFSRCFGKNYGGKRIALDLKLVHLEKQYIKHVLYHEYAHCIEMNHSKKFYDILVKYDKNHRKTKKYISDNLFKYC